MRRLLPTSTDGTDGTDATLDLDDDAALDAAYGVPPGPDGAARPWVRANMVASVDGAISSGGRSAALSGPADQRIFRVLRDHADAVLVGASTVRAEGYEAVRRSEVRAGWRREHGRTEVPAIAVVTSSLDLDPASPLFVGALVPTVVVTTEAAAARRGAAYDGVATLVTTPGERVDLAAALDSLAELGLRQVLCEGGPHLLGHLAASGRLDELCLTVSPLLVSGGGPRLMVGDALGPLRVAPTHLLESDGFLFARYRVHGPAPEDHRPSGLPE